MTWFKTFETFVPKNLDTRLKEFNKRAVGVIFYGYYSNIDTPPILQWCDSVSEEDQQKMFKKFEDVFEMEAPAGAHIIVGIKKVEGIYWTMAYLFDEEEYRVKEFEIEFQMTPGQHEKKTSEMEFLANMGGYAGDFGLITDLERAKR